MTEKQRCARCGDVKILATKGPYRHIMCEDCTLAKLYEQAMTVRVWIDTKTGTWGEAGDIAFADVKYDRMDEFAEMPDADRIEMCEVDGDLPKEWFTQILHRFDDD